MAHEYVIVDLETTGLDLEREEIIEIAAVKVRRGLVTDSFSTLVSCNKRLTPEIVGLTGITDDMLDGQPLVHEAVDMLAQFVGQAELVAHNAEFDSAFLHKYWPDGRVWLDTLTLSRIVFPCATSFALANLAAWLGLELTQAHRALGDAQATAELFLRIDKELDRLPLPAKEDILALAENDATPTGELLRRKCAGVSAATENADKPARANREKRVVDEDYCLDIEQLKTYLGPDSECKQAFPDFEERPQQLSMALAVAETLNDGGTLLVEAGTGTGKSLAYLLPSALFALGSGQQAAISTHTRNLQEQLLHKDIPLAAQLLGRELHAVVVKGRSNYLCRRLYQYLLHNAPENMRYFLMRVAVWRSRSASGDGGELNLNSFEKWQWQRVCASKENCAPFCTYRRRNSCPVQRIRSEAAQADIVVLNHSLLIANAALESGFLPPLPNIIIDEAQHLEDVAEDQLTTGVNIIDVLALLGRLTRREKGRAVGAVSVLRRHVSTLPLTEAEAVEKVLDRLEAGTESVIRAGEGFFDLLEMCFRPKDEQISFFPAQVRILPGHRASDSWPAVSDKGLDFAAELNDLSRDCFRLLDLLAGDNEEQERPAGCEELFGAGGLSREMAATIDTWLCGEDDNYVTWVEFREAGKKPSIAMAPIDVSPILREHLYADARALVFTSATLSAGRDFSYFRQRLGLDSDERPPRELTLPSPFFYRDQALFTVVNDLPDWSGCSQIEAVAAISRALERLITASGGRAIVLFTSHQLLKGVYAQLRGPLREQGVTLLAHGVSGPPSGLVERLKAEERCCILGANSFWEGVDVIGSALSLIVVVRLPFWPPNTPLAQSRMERIEAEGRNSFYEYSLPQALTRFKQGFGRLIRSQSDQGVFCVLDRRIVEKAYGSRFIRCLPEMRRYVGGVEDIVRRVEEWLR